MRSRSSVAGAVILALAAAACQSAATRPTAAQPSSASARPTAAQPPSAAPALASAAPASLATVVRRVAVGGAPDAMVAAQGSLWVGNYNSNTVTRVDPVTGRVRATVSLDDAPIELVAGQGGVWVAGYENQTVSFVSAAANRVIRVLHVGAKPVGLAVVGSDLWVFDQADRDARVFTAAGRPIGRMPTGVHAGWASVDGRGNIWVTDFGGVNGDVVRSDPEHRKITGRFAIGDSPVEVGFGFGSAWFSDYGLGELVRFDPATGRVIAHIAMPDASLGSILVDSTGVWVSDFGGARVLHVNAATNRIDGRIPTGTHPQRIVRVGSTL